MTDISAVTNTVLRLHDVVILGDAVDGVQVTMFSDWVTAGGNLIVMRPDKKLASLLGWTDALATLPDGIPVGRHVYSPAGIVDQTMQFHASAIAMPCRGDAIATLY